MDLKTFQLYCYKELVEYISSLNKLEKEMQATIEDFDDVKNKELEFPVTVKRKMHSFFSAHVLSGQEQMDIKPLYDSLRSQSMAFEELDNELTHTASEEDVRVISEANELRNKRQKNRLIQVERNRKMAIKRVLEEISTRKGSVAEKRKQEIINYYYNGHEDYDNTTREVDTIHQELFHFMYTEIQKVLYKHLDNEKVDIIKAINIATKDAIQKF